MVRLYLVRHATAEQAPPGSRFADPLRALTPKGRRRFHRIARTFARMDEPVDVICTSPALRAVQTAEVLAAAVGSERVRVLDELRPGGTPEPLLGPLRDLDARSVALVGHERQLAALATLLTGAVLMESARLRLRHGSIVRIDVRRLREEPQGKPRWWIGPDRNRRRGLPIAGTAPAGERAS